MASWTTEPSTGPRSQRSDPIPGPWAPSLTLQSLVPEEGADPSDSASSCEPKTKSLPLTSNWKLLRRGLKFPSRLPALTVSDSGSKRTDGANKVEQETGRSFPPTHFTWARPGDLARMPVQQSRPPQSRGANPGAPEAQDAAGGSSLPWSSRISPPLKWVPSRDSHLILKLPRNLRVSSLGHDGHATLSSGRAAPEGW